METQIKHTAQQTKLVAETVVSLLDKIGLERMPSMCLSLNEAIDAIAEKKPEVASDLCIIQYCFLEMVDEEMYRLYAWEKEQKEKSKR
jgi:hypothetical protein